MRWVAGLLLMLVSCADKAGDSGSPLDSGGGDGGLEGTDGGSTDCPDDLDCDGYSSSEGDCDDTDPAVHPGAIEYCNGVDDDCDNDIDEDAGGVYYLDTDGDGYGDPNATVQSCDTPTGVADNGADCDDSDPSVHPGADELNNEVDDDCDGDIDEGAPWASVTLTWSAGGLEVVIEGSASSWELGMAETGAGADGWFGESCVPGEEPWGYNDYGYDFCHPLGASGGSIESVYPDLASVGDEATLFNAAIGDSGDLTYILLDVSGSSCWVWGNEASYYADFGCDPL